MKKNATIAIRGIQRYEGEAEKSEIRFITEGEYGVSDDGFFISYRETALPPDKPVFTNIKTAGGRVSMWRNDSGFADMTFEKGVRHHTLLSTDEGAISLCVVTKDIQNRLGENGGLLKLNYDLEVGGHSLSANTISFKISF